MQCACAILSSVACPALQYFSTLSHKQCDLKKKVIEYKICVIWFSLQGLSDTFLILRRTEWDMVKNLRWCLCKVIFFLVTFYWDLKFLDKFSKNSNIKFHEKSSSGSGVFRCGRKGGRTNRRTDGKTDVTKLIVPFHNYANAPKHWRFEVTWLFQSFLTKSNNAMFGSNIVLSVCLSVCQSLSLSACPSVTLLQDLKLWK